MRELSRGLLPGLHGLRASAALSVFAFHVHSYGGVVPPGFLAAVERHFGLGVQLFFALSAFSLAWANPDAAQRPGPYLVKRFFRIAPLYWLLILPVLVFRPWPGTGRVLAEFGFVFNFVPAWAPGLVPAGWTVGVEMPFYLCLPLLLRIRSLGWLIAAALLGTAVSAFARVQLAALHPGSLYPLMSLASNAWVFLLALVAFRLFERVRETRFAAATARAAALVAIAIMAVTASPIGAVLTGPGHLDALPFGLAFAALCLWQALRPSGVLRCRAAIWLGERSYSIYLAHIPVIVALTPVLSRLTAALGQGAFTYLAALALTLPVVCLLAEMGYRFVERPGMALGRWVIGRCRAHGDVPPPVQPEARSAVRPAIR